MKLTREVSGYQVNAQLGVNDTYADFSISKSEQNHNGHVWRTLVTGTIRWDRCMNSHAVEGAIFHFDDPSEVDALAAAWKVLWEMGPELMPENWDA